ncbi:hornerin-like isoform X2 [Anopheles albimanus]|nr:hornerin-like isoform X2 [Anopheles albimanus]
MYCLCRSSKTIAVRVVLLDETDFLHELQDDLPGQALLDVVYARLNLIETAYFGIRYIDQDNQTHWLDPSARLSRQLKGGKVTFDLYFGVKFYACDPCKLVEEITRYQLYLQVKQDILQGRLPVSFELAAELGAYVVQAELGDYDPRKHPLGYVSEFRLLNNQTKEIECRIHELHIQLAGMSPSQAEFNYLDKVKWHDMYGVDLHPVLGEDSVEYFLGLTPGGIVVLRNKTTVAHYYWPRIAKVYYKGRYFMLRVCDKNNEVSTYGFETPKKSACKHLWKCCVEHHSFFRLVRVAPMQANGTLGSKYSGRSERQPSAKEALPGQQQQRAPPSFTRTPSRRQPRRTMTEMQMQLPPDDRMFDAPKYIQQEIKSISIPQPAQSIPAALNGMAGGGSKSSQSGAVAPPDSPRSTRSAPWMRSQQRGLFGINSSPKSVRSVSTRMSAPANGHSSNNGNGTNSRLRSSSVESHSSNESRPGRHRRRNRSRRVSDNESEMSRGSGRSGRSHNSHRKHRRHRSKNRRNRSDTESRDRSYSGHRRSTDSIELVDSGEQWLEVQRKQHSDAVPKAAVIKSSQVMKGTHPDSGIIQHHHHHRSRRHRKHRSPSDKIWSSELTKHLQFDLVDTAGMTEDQLREIPYTVVETTHAAKKPNTLKVHKTSHHSTTSLSSNHHHHQQQQQQQQQSQHQLQSLPQQQSYHQGNQQHQHQHQHQQQHQGVHVAGNNRIDRIRDYGKGEGSLGENGVNGGSIRSASTISSSREYDRNSGLIRMMSSMSMGDFISPTGSSLSPLDSSGLRVSHEHTDSGLGADQDYAYSSERSSDSAKYGTNKSSGASVTSGHTKSSSSNNMKSHHHTVSSRKPPLCPGRTAGPPPLPQGPTAITQQPQLQQQSPQGHRGDPANKYSSVPGVYSASVGSNSRLINSSNTHYQNNHYTFSLTRNPHQHHQQLQQQRHNLTNNPIAHGSVLGTRGHPLTGNGLSTSTYLDTVATLSSSATPYHYVFDGTGFRPNVVGAPGSGYHPMTVGGGGVGGNIRGTKSDIGVPIRPKRHYQQYLQQQQQQHQQHQQYHQQQYITSVHSASGRHASDRKQHRLTAQASSGLGKSIDYLENYKTGVERLQQQSNSLNNNNNNNNFNNNSNHSPETFNGLLAGTGTGTGTGTSSPARGSGSNQNVFNNNHSSAVSQPFDANRNRAATGNGDGGNGQGPSPGTPTRDDGSRTSEGIKLRTASAGGNENGNMQSETSTVRSPTSPTGQGSPAPPLAPPVYRRGSGGTGGPSKATEPQSSEVLGKVVGGGGGPLQWGTAAPGTGTGTGTTGTGSPGRFAGVGKGITHRSSSLELILTPIIQSHRRAQ